MLIQVKLGTLLWVPFWHQAPKEQVNAGWLHFMLVSQVSICRRCTTHSASFSCYKNVTEVWLVLNAETVPVRTVNRQCSSGLQAVADVAAAIKAGFYDIGTAVLSVSL